MLESMDLIAATREVIAMTSSDLQKNGVSLRTAFAEDLQYVTGDRIQLQQVVLNLLRNASDAMAGVDDRERKVVIKIVLDDNDQARFSIRDSGVGLDRHNLSTIFDAFHSTKSGGMGIGLSVSRSIIARHRGRLWAEANDDHGATFLFSIPCWPERAKST
jgi:signal transduction histidine kinase